MWSFNRICRGPLVPATLLLLLAVAGCTVRPLYQSGSDPAVAKVGAVRVPVTIAEPATRDELEVRNHLIFLLYGGAGMPPGGRYSLSLGVTKQVRAAAELQTITDPLENISQPTAGTVVLVSNYRLVDNETATIIGSGTRTFSAEFDRPRQEYASYRAVREAADRAARELAELLRLALISDLERLGNS